MTPAQLRAQDLLVALEALQAAGEPVPDEMAAEVIRELAEGMSDRSREQVTLELMARCSVALDVVVQYGTAPVACAQLWFYGADGLDTLISEVQQQITPTTTDGEILRLLDLTVRQGGTSFSVAPWDETGEGLDRTAAALGVIRQPGEPDAELRARAMLPPGARFVAASDPETAALVDLGDRQG